ncbi:DUF4124 domain-containing protein [Paucibacter sp. APW11]|uniref:DUF4124 domain-containing protein n=1 Tax=Roseateles aquae TaxID=3077235 RepID=A0ABU3P9G7_9BURK|nr:DUF4124 domain-containing protein [Paucibacter sp. APW11]MDT8999201.1 DUF4124 domain-containing protein [Paucibacter sp. APW11]
MLIAPRPAHRTTSAALLCIGLLALTMALPAQAQWKWRDAGGKIQYSDLPPPSGVAEKDILQRPPGQRRIIVAPVPAPGAQAASQAASAAQPAERAASKPDADQQARQRLEQELQLRQKEEQRKQAEIRAENCKRARSQLQSLDSGIRITRTDDKGEISYLDDKQRAEEARRIRDLIGSDCR